MGHLVRGIKEALDPKRIMKPLPFSTLSKPQAGIKD